MATAFRRIPAADHFISEPPPDMFGNGPNADPNVNWLKSRFHFSFAEYRNPRKEQFGVLRVMNDDLVQANRGFGTHPHANMEIVTYVVDGSLTHKDSMGTEESLGRGSVQFMTAGTGVRHSEYNRSPSDPLRFIQMWILPSQRQLKPNYGSTTGDAEKRRNRWQHLVTSVEHRDAAEGVIRVHQDVNIHVAEITGGTTLDFTVGSGRQAYMLCVEGTIRVVHPGGEETLERHDSATTVGEAILQLKPEGDGHVLVVEMKRE